VSLYNTRCNTLQHTAIRCNDAVEVAMMCVRTWQGHTSDVEVMRVMSHCTDKLSAIDMTAKAIFAHLVLVPRPRRFEPFATKPYAPTPPPLMLQLFLDFLVFWLKLFPGVAHQFLSQHGRQVIWLSPGTLTATRCNSTWDLEVMRVVKVGWACIRCARVCVCVHVCVCVCG